MLSRHTLYLHGQQSKNLDTIVFFRQFLLYIWEYVL